MSETANRAYPKPVPENDVSTDVHALRAAFDMIDADMASVFSGLSGKAAAVHSHGIDDISGLNSAIAARSPLGHSHELNDLMDVSVGGASPGQVLYRTSTGWVPGSPLSVLGAHQHALSDVSGLASALVGKLDVGALAAAAAKVNPVNADHFPILDSAASGALRRVSWANIKAALMAVFDGVYASLAQGHAPGDLKLSARASPDAKWLRCDGAAYSRVTYAALFAAVGTAFGPGDGSTTFNVPNIAPPSGVASIFIYSGV